MTRCLNGRSLGKSNPCFRLESVRKPLNSLKGGKPQCQLHPRCKALRKDFQGRYEYRRFKILGSEERFHDKPDKSRYSHPHDALQ